MPAIPKPDAPFLPSEADACRLLVQASVDHAMVVLDPDGRVASWNPGAERLKGYTGDEIIGEHFSRFYPPEEVAAGKPERELQYAREDGRMEDEGWRVRKDGTRFWADVVITPLIGDDGELQGYAKVTRDLSERKRLEDEMRRHCDALEAQLDDRTIALTAANRELEAFAYSISHDLRAPLRSLDGFSQILLEDYSESLDPQASDYLERLRVAAVRMGVLIEDLLGLSRITRREMARRKLSLSAMAGEIVHDLKERDPSRRIEWIIAPDVVARGDDRLLRVALENLLENAWKFTSQHPTSRVEFGVLDEGPIPSYFVRDDGAGFDPSYTDRLFGAFQRLHSSHDFEGTGIGLATVQRIIHRHGGRVWAEGQIERGATFYFTLAP